MDADTGNGGGALCGSDGGTGGAPPGTIGGLDVGPAVLTSLDMPCDW